MVLLCAFSRFDAIPLFILDRYPKNIAAATPRPIYLLYLLEVTVMTGEPHRPSSRSLSGIAILAEPIER